MRKLQRGEVVLATDPYNGSGRRPFIIISDESYPFYPSGYLGVPMTRKDKSNTLELHAYDVVEEFEPFEKDSTFVNPYSPAQVNEYGRSLCIVGDEFMDMLAHRVSRAIGLRQKA